MGERGRCRRSASRLTVGLGKLIQFSKLQFLLLENGHEGACYEGYVGPMCVSEK